MLELITFFVAYYHVFFICSAVVIFLDYVLEIDIFKDLRELMDSTVCFLYIGIELCIGFAFGAAYITGSTAVMSALWIITVVLILSVLFFGIVHLLHVLFDID